MRRFALFAAGLGVLCSEAWGKAREVVRLRPVEPWNLHYADDSCRMARTFGTGKHQVILVLDRFEPSDWFRMMFVGKPGSENGLRSIRSQGPVRPERGSIRGEFHDGIGRRQVGAHCQWRCATGAANEGRKGSA